MTSKQVILDYMASKAALGLVMAGFLVIGFGFFAGSSGGGGGTTDRICDLAGTIVGKTHDDNVFKFVEIYSINLSPTNCHDRQWYELSMFSLFTTGYGNISVKAIDDTGGVAREVKFVITTVAGEVEKSFTQNIRIPSLVQGDTYTIQVNAPDWEGGQIKGTKQITV